MTEAGSRVAGSSMADVRPRKMLFVGVSTSESLATKAFPAWMQIIGQTAVALEGVDIPVGATASTYRRLLERLRSDSAIVGALVTTHKAALFDYCADQFDSIGRSGRLLCEIGAVVTNAGRIDGDATDPVALNNVLSGFLLGDSWSEGRGQALVLGAGGAGLALAFALLTRSGVQADHLTITDSNERRLTVARSVLGKIASAERFQVLLAAGDANDLALSALPEGSLVANATGRGKDQEGSPLSSLARFPRRGIAWEFNYRGEREFLAQAKAQEAALDLHIADGWSYFGHGWAQVIGRIFGIDADQRLVEAFLDAARAASIE